MHDQFTPRVFTIFHIKTSKYFQSPPLMRPTEVFRLTTARAWRSPQKCYRSSGSQILGSMFEKWFDDFFRRFIDLWFCRKSATSSLDWNRAPSAAGPIGTGFFRACRSKTKGPFRSSIVGTQHWLTPWGKSANNSDSSFTRRSFELASGDTTKNPTSICQ